MEGKSSNSRQSTNEVKRGPKTPNFDDYQQSRESSSIQTKKKVFNYVEEGKVDRRMERRNSKAAESLPGGKERQKREKSKSKKRISSHVDQLSLVEDDEEDLNELRKSLDQNQSESTIKQIQNLEHAQQLK
mmetsp:Transcript_18048/g.30775  ORF Transcript_18048/g.30775 Transcript_18048/m.30775 type:complete len:131 (+) Transcript_18048:43-435(+)